MTNETLHSERMSSNKTEALFIALMIVFLVLAIWRGNTSGMDLLTIIFISVTGLFLFYVINYRTLQIQITDRFLKLKFGLFTWNVLLENIEDCRLDHPPLFAKYGGAGIHFMFVRGRYRASFNFLEYPRVVAAFRKKIGPVQDISFSTRDPETVMRVIRAARSEVPSL